MKFFSRSKKKGKGRTSAYARPRWVNLPQAENESTGLNVDFDKLADHGFITRSTMDSVLAREFSLIKRRLFRRLDYFDHTRKGEKRTQDERCPLVLVTSSKPGEGKTFGACNLVLSLAFDEQIKVLLIDTDLAKPSVPEIFGFPEAQPGLYDCLKDPTRNVWNDIQKVAGTRLMILPTGEATSSPASLFGSDAMLKILDQVSHGKNAFDFVVMDGPPLLATTEAAILTQYADEIMLMVGAKETTTSQIQSSIAMLPDKEKINLVINHMPFGEPLPTEYGDAHHSAAA
ncbi:MAG: CpsD/CapB family tyrosine-protein kinase [Pseudomonadota bacterium]